ncbi:hypothetical protein QL285_081434 [Trifolium repens]|nr:hypothetical protein QL285_081434 [Trifolium repens]
MEDFYMHLHSYKGPLSHLHPFTSTASFPTLIPDSKNFKEIMENWQKQIDDLRGDVDQLTDKLDRVLEILASLSLPSRVDAATVGENPPIDPPLSKVVWPSFGSSSGYTSAAAQVTQEPMGTNTEFMVGQRRTHQVQPKFAHQDDNFKGKSVVPPSEETRQRLKAIEDKLRIMESFLPNNICPPRSHSRSTVHARTSCSKHQYPVTVQPQQSQGFPKQAIQTPLNHSQSGQFAQNPGQQLNQPKATREKKVIDPIPMPCSQLLSYLVHNGMLTPRTLKPMIAPFPNWYDPKAKCEFHLGAEGHTIDNCKAFKYKVQELFDQKLLIFKKEETNYVTSKKGPAVPTQISYFRYSYVATTSQGQYPQPLFMAPQQNQQQQHNRYQPKNQHGPRKERRNVHYDRIPMPYGQILPHLLQKGLVQLKPLDPVSPPYPPGFDENARCDYHNGSPGHNIENCKAFKYKVQELIDQKLLTFQEGEPNCEG